jgi:hypothetical protein
LLQWTVLFLLSGAAVQMFSFLDLAHGTQFTTAKLLLLLPWRVDWILAELSTAAAAAAVGLKAADWDFPSLPPLSISAIDVA